METNQLHGLQTGHQRDTFRHLPMTKLDHDLWRIQGWIHARSGRKEDRKMSLMASQEETMSMLQVGPTGNLLRNEELVQPDMGRKGQKTMREPVVDTTLGPEDAVTVVQIVHRRHLVQGRDQEVDEGTTELQAMVQRRNLRRDLTNLCGVAKTRNPKMEQEMGVVHLRNQRKENPPAIQAQIRMTKLSQLPKL